MLSSKREKKFFLVFIFCFSILSCNYNNNHGESIIGEEYFSINEKKIDHIFEIGQIEKIVKPETTDDSLFAFADRIKIDAGGNIFVLDKSSQNVLLRFDKNGRFLNKYGRRGQGPGEYQTEPPRFFRRAYYMTPTSISEVL